MPLGVGREIPFFQKIEGCEAPGFLKNLPMCGVFRVPLSAIDAWNIVNALIGRRMLTANNIELMSEIVRHRDEKQQLVTIGTALSSHNNLNALLSLMLAESRQLAGADAGIIYIREKSVPGGPFIDALRFKISQNDSVDVLQAAEFVIPMNKETIAGYVATTGEPLTIDDVYRLPASAPYKFGKEWDRKLGYRMKSMLTIPLKNMAGEVVGILQLMNKKKDRKARLSSVAEMEAQMTPFTVSDEDFMASIGSQAAVSIERVQLYGEIEAIFEGYLKSSVAAIDERDRITYGHSQRVMGYAMAFADAVNAARLGPFKDVSFSEERKNQFRFAALLHDIGKIGVPEALLMKETKLSKEAMTSLDARVELIKLSIATAAPGGKPSWNSPEEIDADRAFLETINHAGFLSDGDYARLSSLRAKVYFNGSGVKKPFLSDGEWKSLSIRKGNLTDEERERINSHAVSTRRILSRIPWTKNLENIPDIACHHHERMDGSGYPDGLMGDRIGLESRALAVIDIFEALVAQDRPYKPKMPPDQAIAILRSEAKANHLDPDIVEFFVSSEIYKIFPGDQPSHEDRIQH
jgi:HD-GYP domain-containing protein (c-di-GMP phosphodiesterase class II)